jgi:ankyrin repeat protein
MAVAMDDLADRFVDLACLTYGNDESRTRRTEASALLAATPGIVNASVHAAAAAGDVDAVRVHLERDARSVELRATSRDWVPLMALCYSRVEQRDALACLELLLERGADPNAYVMITGCRFTALTGVIGEGEAGPFEQPPHPQARALAERLLNAGASPDDAQAIYNTHFLPSNAWLELLLAHGLSSPGDLQFLLGQAAVQGFVERVRLLLAHRVSADGRNHYKARSHLENALLEGHADVARLLEAAGAREPSFSKRDLFRVAVLANEADAARALPGVSADSDALIAASRHGNLAAVELGLALGIPIDRTDAEGLTALHHAARNGHLDVVRTLVARGASTTVRDPQYDGTALGHARHFTSRWPRTHGAEVVAFLEQLER